MSAADPPSLSSKSFTSTSRESSCDSDQKPSNWDEYRVDEENSQSTYLECQNQLHYYEKYHERTGRLHPMMDRQYALPDLEADGSIPDTENAEEKVRHSKISQPHGP